MPGRVEEGPGGGRFEAVAVDGGLGGASAAEVEEEAKRGGEVAGVSAVEAMEHFEHAGFLAEGAVGEGGDGGEIEIASGQVIGLGGAVVDDGFFEGADAELTPAIDGDVFGEDAFDEGAWPDVGFDGLEEGVKA